MMEPGGQVRNIFFSFSKEVHTLATRSSSAAISVRSLKMCVKHMTAKIERNFPPPMVSDQKKRKKEKTEKKEKEKT